MNKTLKITNIPVEKLTPNPWNPNRMSPEMRHKLKEYIKREGFVEPIVVRPKGEGFEILGGFHRWSIAGELGYHSVPCVVLNLDDRRAKILSVNLNEMKGQSLPDLLANLVHDLSRETTLEDLETLLPYSINELKDSLELLKIPDGLEAYLAAEAARQEKLRPQILSFVVDDAEVVEAAIRAAMAHQEKNPTRGQALLEICRYYLAGNK
jgi:ParB family chromosome partitioning protein